jgi:D-alanine-D-alanine ligase
MVPDERVSPKLAGVVFGGTGPEHGVSCLSARSIVIALESRGYVVHCFGITQSGQWVLVPNSTVTSYAISDSRLPKVSSTKQLATLSLDPTEPGFVVGGRLIPCPVVFPVVHGAGGEDGSLQGLFESAGISYVGSEVEASAVAMNKVTSKRIVHSLGINTGNWMSVSDPDAAELAVQLKSLFSDRPYFIKPVSGGSSAGITRVTQGVPLADALSAAGTVSNQIIIEEAIDSPREIEVAILEAVGGIVASPVGEIRVREEFDFYNFEAKYLDDGAELIAPAHIDTELADQIRELALVIFKALGCRDYARVDFFVDQDARIIFNEINTIPGFTSISMFSKMWEAGGIPFNDLVDQLVGNARARSTSIFEAGS